MQVGSCKGSVRSAKIREGIYIHIYVYIYKEKDSSGDPHGTCKVA